MDAGERASLWTQTPNALGPRRTWTEWARERGIERRERERWENRKGSIMIVVRHIISAVSGETPKILRYPWLINISRRPQARPYGAYTLQPQCLSLFVFHTHRPQKYTEEDFVPLLFPCSPLPAPPSPINNRNNDFPERPCLVFGIWGVPGVAVGYHHRVRCGVSATEWVRVENV